MTDHPQLWDAGPVRITGTTGRSHKAAIVPAQCAEILEDGTQCPNRRRRAQGARYCEEHARSLDYRLNDRRPPPITARCIGCDKTFTRRRKTTAAQPARAAWDEFCPGCTDDSPLTLDSLIRHNVPADLVRLWLTARSDLRCEFPRCGRRLSSSDARGKPRIDHDHQCCGNSTSCGACVRGVICPQCNTKVGYLELLIAQHALGDAVDYIENSRT